MFVILVYDINKKRVNKVYKVCLKYLTHIQKSVFEGMITESKLEKLKREITVYINPKEDSVCVYRIDSIKYTCIAEIFKPIIIDRVIFKLINKGMIDSNTDFETNGQNAVYLNNSGKKIFLSEYEYKLYTKITVNGTQLTYDGLIRQEIRKIFKAVHYGEVYKPFKYTL